MKFQIEYKNKLVSDIQELISCFPKSEFDSPYRSTVPLLTYWKEPNKSLIAFSNLIGFSEISNTKLSFEHCIYSPKGKGRPSQTDLMILNDKNAIAIEAKYTEPPYETTATWLGDSLNKKTVLEGWIDLLNSANRKKNVEIQDVLELPYQIVHRCASVCYFKESKKYLIYQCFSLDYLKTEYYRTCLATLKQLLDSSIDFVLINVPIERGSELNKLQQKWDAGERKMYDQVFSNIQKSNFIEFGQPDVMLI